MDAVNAAARGFFDLAWRPFEGLPAWIGLFVLGILFGVVALIAMKYTTNPRRVTALKDRYQGHILAIKLFRDSFTVVIGSLVKTLFWVGGYLAEQFKPMALLIVPFVLIFAQMQMRLGFRPLDLEKEVLVTVELDATRVSGLPDVALDLPEGVVAARPPVREPSLHREVFALIPKTAGLHELRFRLGSEVEVKSLAAGPLEGTPMVSPVRSADFWDRLLYPAEAGFSPTSAFTRISLAYPVRPLPFLGLDLSFKSDVGMMFVFVLLTIVAAFALKDLFGVTI
jgi:hypothetical protein